MSILSRPWAQQLHHKEGENCIRYVFHGLKHPKCKSRVLTRFGGLSYYTLLWACKLTVHKSVLQIFESEILVHNLVKHLQLSFTMLRGSQLPNQNYVLLRICISSDSVGIDQHGRQPKCWRHKEINLWRRCLLPRHRPTSQSTVPLCWLLVVTNALQSRVLT